MIEILSWLFGILIIGIMLLGLAIMHYFKVCKDFIKNEGLENYKNKKE